MKAKIYYFTVYVFLNFSDIFATTNYSHIPYEKYQAIVRPAVERMTLKEKLGQMTLVKFGFLQPTSNQIDYNLINQYHLGAVLAAGGEVPNGVGGVNDGINQTTFNLDEPSDYLNSTARNWISINHQVDENPVITIAGDVIPLLIGVDAVHGQSIILGNVIFPHNIGLSMTHHGSLLNKVGYWTAHDALETGFNWVYAPTVAISHNPDWGRTYESLGSIPKLTENYTIQLVNGFQQSHKGKITGVLATVKHYLGDGATFDGIDEGDTKVNDFNRFLNVNGAGYKGAMISNSGSIMVSYSAINNLPMTFNRKLVTDYLIEGKHDYFGHPFRGLIVSDYGAIDKAASQGLPTTTTHTPYPEALAKAINSGIDLIMLSSTAQYEKNLGGFLELFQQVVESGAIPIERINEAVTRILAVKYAMGLIEINAQGYLIKGKRPTFPTYKEIYKKTAGSARTTEIKTALKAAEESLVLLKNSNDILPLEKEKIEYIILVGTSLINVRQDDGTYIPTFFANYNNIGIQTGGWTVSWQGIEGNDFWLGKYKISSGASSVLDGLKKLAPQATLITTLQELAQFPQVNAKNSVIVGVLAEPPYAEFMGDVACPFCFNSTTNVGCLYNYHLNPYLPLQQRSTLEINYAQDDLDLIAAVKTINQKIPLISILFSGRPMIIQQPGKISDAFIAAWLPGTTGGQAVANALFGRYQFRKSHYSLGEPNSLTMEWVRNMQQLKNYPVYRKGRGFVAYRNPLFNIGYGLKSHKAKRL